MDYYVSKKAGSIIFRAPQKQHLIAGSHIPAETWNALDGAAKQELLKTGMIEGFEDVDSVKLADAPEENLPSIGSGRDKFMPEAKVQLGERKDAALTALLREQATRTAQSIAESEVDEDAGGSADGVVKVVLPPEEVDEDDEGYEESGDTELPPEDVEGEDALTDEERAAIDEMEREEQGGS